MICRYLAGLIYEQETSSRIPGRKCLSIVGMTLYKKALKHGRLKKIVLCLTINFKFIFSYKPLYSKRFGELVNFM